MNQTAVMWASEQQLGLTEKAVLVTLALMADEDGCVCGSQRQIAARAGASRETINRRLASLAERGLIDRSGTAITLPVTESHTPCDVEPQPPVTQSHTPCGTESHPGVGTPLANIRGRAVNTPSPNGEDINNYLLVNTSPKERKIPKERNPPSARDRRRDQGKSLVAGYGRLVKAPALDSSRHQARINAAKLLAAGHSFEDLEQAVRNYAEWREARGYGQEFAVNAGNFFGRREVFMDFLPGAYEPVDPDAGRDELVEALKAVTREKEREDGRIRSEAKRERVCGSVQGYVGKIGNVPLYPGAQAAGERVVQGVQQLSARGGEGRNGAGSGVHRQGVTDVR